MIEVHSKRSKITKRDTTLKNNTIFLDVTSKSTNQYIKFSPFYPHGNIPIPFSEENRSQTVEGIWQGLKYIENEGIDESRFHIINMKNIKRKGHVLGHQKGTSSTTLLSYLEARIEIYIPTYNWILENLLTQLIEEIYHISKFKDVILLDYNTNQNIENVNTPLSHAYLIKKYIEEHY